MTTPQNEPSDTAADKGTRIGAAWTAVALAAIVLLMLLIFILQNQDRVNVTFFGGHGELPLGVALLLAAVGGALLVVVLGVARMIQLKAAARQHRKALVDAELAFRQRSRGGCPSDTSEILRQTSRSAEFDLRH